MIAIDTEEKLNWLLNGLENGEIVVVSKKRTAEEKEELRREIEAYKAMHLEENKIEEPACA